MKEFLILFVASICVILIADGAFILINAANTMANIGGVLLLVLTVCCYIKFLPKLLKKKNNEEND